MSRKDDCLICGAIIKWLIHVLHPKSKLKVLSLTNVKPKTVVGVIADVHFDGLLPSSTTS